MKRVQKEGDAVSVFGIKKMDPKCVASTSGLFELTSQISTTKPCPEQQRSQETPQAELNEVNERRDAELQRGRVQLHRLEADQNGERQHRVRLEEELRQRVLISQIRMAIPQPREQLQLRIQVLEKQVGCLRKMAYLNEEIRRKDFELNTEREQRITLEAELNGERQQRVWVEQELWQTDNTLNELFPYDTRPLD